MTTTIWTHIASYATAIREFVAPTYRPERYYMRGPGPAYARRQGRPLERPVSFR
jgi:hypothetical protein